MSFITRYKVKKALQEIIPQEHQESRLKLIFNKFIKIIKFFYKITFLGLFARWLNRQAFGTIIAVFTLIMFIAIIIANQLRYYYYQNIMRASYPNEVLGVVDKVLFVFNARQMNLNYWIFTIIFIMILVTFNRKYCSSKPQSIPRAKVAR